MNGLLRAAADRALRYSPAQLVYSRQARECLAVLAYHEVCDPTSFRRQVDVIVQEFRPVSLQDVLRAVRSGESLPHRAVLITFDDGHRSVLDVAMPILRERNIPAVAFVVAGLLGTDQPFWWSEVEELVQHGGSTSRAPSGASADEVIRALKHVPNPQRLAALEELRASAHRPARPMPQLHREELRTLEEHGIAIGNHTLTHPCLDQCSEATIRRELSKSQDLLAEILGHRPRVLAYPNGDEDPRVVQAAADCGFEAAFLFDHQLSDNPPRNPLRISRLRVDAGASLDRFRIILSGLHPALHRLRGGR